MIDASGTLLLELREDGAVAAIVGQRVAISEPKPGWAGGKEYQAFIVIAPLATPRDRRVPLQRPRYAVNCYGRTSVEAWALYGACSDAVHDIGPRVRQSNGLGIYISADDTGGTADKDPDTAQPLVTFVVELIATTVAVA